MNYRVLNYKLYRIAMLGGSFNVDSGRPVEFWEIGMFIFTLLIIVANFKIFIISSIHNGITVFFVLGGILIYLLCFYVFNLLQSDYYSYGLFNM